LDELDELEGPVKLPEPELEPELELEDDPELDPEPDPEISYS
jgi:hypothetical protein